MVLKKKQYIQTEFNFMNKNLTSIETKKDYFGL